MTIQQLIHQTPLTTSEFGRNIAGNFKKWLKGTFGDRKFMIYPGVYQNSDEFREFRFNLFQELQPIADQINSHEFSSATQLLGEMGQGCSHVLLPFNNANVLRKELALVEPSESDYAILDELISRMLKAADFESISVKDKSSSGYPFFIKGVGYKLSVAGEIFKKVPEIMKACRQHDLEAVRSVIGSLPFYSHGVRYQLDGIRYENGVASCSKQREWFDYEFVKTNGVKGKKGLMDYSVRNEKGLIDKRFVASRVRSMYALNYHYNCILQVVNNYCIHGLKEIAPEMVYSTPDDTVNRLGGFNDKLFHTIDYGNYGETIPGEVVNRLAFQLNNRFPGLGDFVKMTYSSPRIVRSYKRNENEPDIIGTEDVFADVTSGLCSGNGLVALIGKLCAIWDGAIVFRKIIGRSFRLDYHLNNYYSSYKRMTSSDDGICKIYDDGLEREYIENISKLSIFKTTITQAPEFLGYLYLKDYVTRDLGKLCGHLTNYERGMKSKMFFELGVGCSINEYQTNKYFSKVYPVLKKHFKMLKVDLEEYRRQAGTLATPTAIFLSNPESIFYKLDPKLVNSDIYQKFFANISREFIMTHFERLK